MPLFNSGKQITADSGLPSPLFHGLSSTTPNADGTNVTEPVGNGYARQSVTMGAADASGLRESTTAHQFAAVGGDWGTMTYSVFYTALTAGTPVMFDDLNAARNMIDGATMDFAIGDVDYAQN
ncbi:MAG: hypothetical protein QNJ71_11115 [Acidimicrobiia bacterium]|nr:hypothetical protein [Acidimicrobiia bacterium]